MRVEQLALGDPADEVLGERVAVHRVEGVAQRVDRHRPVDPLVEDPVQDVAPGLGHLERAPQQVGEQVHGDALLAQHLGEAVVLLLGAVHPQHVVEQQPVLVARGEPQQLGAGTVQDHLAQAPDLGVDPKAAGREPVIAPFHHPRRPGGEMEAVRLDPRRREDHRAARRGRPPQLRRPRRPRRADGVGGEAPGGPAARGRGDRRVHGAAGARRPWAGRWRATSSCTAATAPRRRRSGRPIARFPEIVDASTISGEADALLRIVAADMHHFERVLEQIGAQPFVARTKSVLVLSALLRRPVTPRHDEP